MVFTDTVRWPKKNQTNKKQKDGFEHCPRGVREDLPYGVKFVDIKGVENERQELIMNF